MKNLMYLLVFSLALATAYAISQNPPTSPLKQTVTPPAPETPPPSAVLTTPEPLTVAPADEVREAIENAIRREAGQAGDSVHVNVDDESIELSGTVASGKSKLTVHRLAESYAVNRRVRDEVTVASQSAAVPNAASPAQPRSGQPSATAALNTMR